jgi:N-dimethylarginine dimethylaminohydrolase
VNARDFAVNSPEGVVIGRFKYSERRGEEVPGEKQLRKLGYTIFGRIERGCWEGGDNKYIDDKNLATGTGERSTWPGIHSRRRGPAIGRRLEIGGVRHGPISTVCSPRSPQSSLSS